MNREQAKQLLPIIQAFADGADVQAVRGDGTWFDVENPRFYGGDNYRIKPKPLERWLVVDRDGDARVEPRGFFDESSALQAAERLLLTGIPYAPYRVVQLREVTE